VWRRGEGSSMIVVGGGRLMGIIIGVQVPLHELDVVVVDTVHFELAH
jgi:hypothetical protein